MYIFYPKIIVFIKYIHKNCVFHIFFVIIIDGELFLCEFLIFENYTIMSTIVVIDFNESASLDGRTKIWVATGKCQWNIYFFKFMFKYEKKDRNILQMYKVNLFFKMK